MMRYAVEVFMRSSRDDQKEPLWQQNIYLVSANNVAEVQTRGEELGRQAENEYLTVGGARIRWHFVEVSSIAEIERLEDSEEIFGRFIREGTAKEMMAPLPNDE